MVSDRKPTFVMSKYYLSKEEIKIIEQIEIINKISISVEIETKF